MKTKKSLLIWITSMTLAILLAFGMFSMTIPKGIAKAVDKTYYLVPVNNIVSIKAVLSDDTIVYCKNGEDGKLTLQFEGGEPGAPTPTGYSVGEIIEYYLVEFDQQVRVNTEKFPQYKEEDKNWGETIHANFGTACEQEGGLYMWHYGSTLNDYHWISLGVVIDNTFEDDANHSTAGLEDNQLKIIPYYSSMGGVPYSNGGCREPMKIDCRIDPDVVTIGTGDDAKLNEVFNLKVEVFEPGELTEAQLAARSTAPITNEQTIDELEASIVAKNDALDALETRLAKIEKTNNTFIIVSICLGGVSVLAIIGCFVAIKKRNDFIKY